ncbi:hypothetical protein HT031_000428 [Scenedesmus sp. PABB004]|nr:hypothetical protein HT031_000428 [Scenedesmus sp. PABB004]
MDARARAEARRQKILARGADRMTAILGPYAEPAQPDGDTGPPPASAASPPPLQQQQQQARPPSAAPLPEQQQQQQERELAAVAARQQQELQRQQQQEQERAAAALMAAVGDSLRRAQAAVAAGGGDAAPSASAAGLRARGGAPAAVTAAAAAAAADASAPGAGWAPPGGDDLPAQPDQGWAGAAAAGPAAAAAPRRARRRRCCGSAPAWAWRAALLAGALVLLHHTSRGRRALADAAGGAAGGGAGALPPRLRGFDVTALVPGLRELLAAAAGYRDLAAALSEDAALLLAALVLMSAVTGGQPPRVASAAWGAPVAPRRGSGARLSAQGAAAPPPPLLRRLGRPRSRLLLALSLLVCAGVTASVLVAVRQQPESSSGAGGKALHAAAPPEGARIGRGAPQPQARPRQEQLGGEVGGGSGGGGSPRRHHARQDAGRQAAAGATGTPVPEVPLPAGLQQLLPGAQPAQQSLPQAGQPPPAPPHGAPGGAVAGGAPASAAAASAPARGAAGGPPRPARRRFPVWWHGPVFSGSGYGSEAINFVLSLARAGRGVSRGDVWASHHGDVWREHVVAALAPEDRAELEHLTTLPAEAARERAAIVVCHSVPTNWAVPEPVWQVGARCPPDPRERGWVYTIGRTMFETDSLPAEFVPRLNAMTEVWVPSAWQRETFAASGVSPHKLRVVPEGVNTTYFDPAAHTPLDLAARAQLVFGQPWPAKAGAARARAKAGAGAAPPARPYRFISAFKWEERKGWSTLLTAYLQARPRHAAHATRSAPRFKDKMRGWAGKLPPPPPPPPPRAGGSPAPRAGGARAAATGTARPRQLLAQCGRGAWGAASNCSSPAGGGADAAPAHAPSAGGADAAPAHAPGDVGDAQLRQRAHVAGVVTAIRALAQSLAAGDGRAGESLRRSLQERGAGDARDANALDADTRAARHPTLYVVDSHISDADFPRFYKAGDAFVLPTRGEGWGRPQVEAMSMALPVLSTNWSGITAFLDESVGYPLAIDGLVPVQGGAEVLWWFRGQRWAQPSVEHLRQLMRRVFTRRGEAAARGAAARARMVERYSPGAIAELVLDELRRVEDAIP